jgi:hypothetical protein
MTTKRRRKSRVRVWFIRNTLWLALIAIIILSFSAGAISCLIVVGRNDDTMSSTTVTCAPVTTVLQPNTADESTPPLELITEPEVFYFEVPLSDDFQDYIRAKCIEYDVPMELVIALIDKESSFRADVVSNTDDYGYMQINKFNHEWLSETLGVSNFLDPYENVLCGIYIIAGHLHKTDGDIVLALMRYNCGATGAKKLWDKGIYSTDYTDKIMTAYNSYIEESRPTE